MMDVLAESHRIKNRLRACLDGAEVDAVAAEERDTVLGWKGQKGDAGAMYHQVINLKMQMVSGFSVRVQGRAA